jgi:metallo-beta-lactamase family protein
VKEGFAGDILLTPASKELFPLLTLDSAKSQEEDAAFKKKRHEKEGRIAPHPEAPLYKVEDAEKCFPLLKEVSYEEDVSLNSNVKLRLHDAGHILGSAMVELTCKGEEPEKTIVFTGDMGRSDQPLLPDPYAFEAADYVVMESTYGDRDHGSQEHIEAKLAQVINDTVSAGGNVLVPTFVVERAQELIFHLGRLAKEKKIPYVLAFLDSPLAVEITKIFEKYSSYFEKQASKPSDDVSPLFKFPGLSFSESVEASKAINLVKGSVIVMAGSGMITGGRIKHHLTRGLTRPECTLLFVGYQAQGTLGRQILDGNSPVRVLGQYYPVRMKIEKIDGLSAHADMTDLEHWLNHFKSPPKHVFLTHGEEQAIQNLETYLNSKSGWNVSAPSYLEEYDL